MTETVTPASSTGAHKMDRVEKPVSLSVCTSKRASLYASLTLMSSWLSPTMPAMPLPMGSTMSWLVPSLRVPSGFAAMSTLRAASTKNMVTCSHSMMSFATDSRFVTSWRPWLSASWTAFMTWNSAAALRRSRRSA